MERIKEKQVDAMAAELDRLEAVDKVTRIIEEVADSRTPSVMAWRTTARAFLKEFSYGVKHGYDDVFTILFSRGVLEGEERILWRMNEYPVRTEEDRRKLADLWDAIMTRYLEG